MSSTSCSVINPLAPIRARSIQTAEQIRKLADIIDLDDDDIEECEWSQSPSKRSKFSDDHDPVVVEEDDDDATEPPRVDASGEADAEMSAAIEVFKERILPGRIDITQLAETTVDEFRALPDPSEYAQKNPFPIFDRTQFFDVNPNDPTDTHYYMVWNEFMNDYERCRGSVTGAIHAPFEHFDPKAHAKRIADSKRRYGEYAGLDAAQIEHLWEFGANCGSAFHKSAELFINTPLGLTAPTCTSTVFRTIEFSYFLDFVRDRIIGQVDIVRTELRLTDWIASRENTHVADRIRAGTYYPHDPLMQVMLPMTKLAGSADLICHRRSDEDPYSVEIWDWKRSKKIRDTAFKKGQCGKWPCHTQEDCNQEHYNLQLNMYQWMLENNTKYRVKRRLIVVFHPSNESYMVYEVPDLQTTIQRLMIQRLQENAAMDLDAPDRKRVATEAERTEHKRYKKQIEEYFEKAPKDHTDMRSYVTLRHSTSS